ncbi:ABC transporter ATP-binding protein [Agaribacterium haliotis]|uniref:ABC transporter ATP-binding protein n=1 Tax=Agaribacterium haliotis TaxID=2013869 RepID=UPI000BB5669E|nr:ABC transporter ATP-binding protein [Agaribacterium haliotis]
MDSILSIQNLNKYYDSGFQALKSVTLDIERGEIFALLGPNGAGKTTLISIVCSVVKPSSGSISVNGMDLQAQYKEARKQIGVVPQELAVPMFETVWASLCFSRGLYGKAPNPAYLEQLLKSLSLWDKKDNKIMTLSGGMKRRVLIAKALAHEPSLLFLDEPTAGVDVELRKDMWRMIDELRAKGTTIILTTHYIEEAEEMADRIGIINKGEILLVDKKEALLNKLGKKQLRIELSEALNEAPPSLLNFGLQLEEQGKVLSYHYDASEKKSINSLLSALAELPIEVQDIQSKQSSLEEIFVSLLNDAEQAKQSL